jgi:DNA-binding response OmpR family regulator
MLVREELLQARIDDLEYQIECLKATLNNGEDDIKKYRLTEAQARTFSVLRPDVVVTHDRMMEGLFWDKSVDDYPELPANIVARDRVRRLRERLEKYNAPWEIISYKTVGYMRVRKESIDAQGR